MYYHIKGRKPQTAQRFLPSQHGFREQVAKLYQIGVAMTDFEMVEKIMKSGSAVVKVPSGSSVLGPEPF